MFSESSSLHYLDVFVRWLVLSCLQGMTIKPLVELLDVKRKKRVQPTVSEEIHSRVRNDSTYRGCNMFFNELRYRHCICIIRVVV